MPDINTLLLREAAERVEAFDAASERARAAIREAIDACRAAAAACERVVAEAEGRAHDAAVP